MGTSLKLHWLGQSVKHPVGIEFIPVSFNYHLRGDNLGRHQMNNKLSKLLTSRVDCVRKIN